MVVIIDYNVGNLSSVAGALKRVGIDAIVTRDKDTIEQAQAIILPGVGSFPVAMANLEKYGLVETLTRCKEKGTIIMGICLGMQVLFEMGYEVRPTKGLGFIPGKVEYMDIDEKIPHMGWNELYFNQSHPILKYIEENEDVYYVHSYQAVTDDENIIAYSMYGTAKIPGIVGKDNVIGCQFHPEKSGAVGENILKAFKEMIEC